MAAGFGNEVASTTETTSTSGTETSTTETDTTSEESHEFDDEDFAELQRVSFWFENQFLRKLRILVSHKECPLFSVH